MTAKKAAFFIVLAVAVTLPGTYVRLSGTHLTAPMIALEAGIAILGAAFLLLWACDVAQLEVSQTLALAAVALFGVLPEYAVDMYFTWQAGKNPHGGYAQYAIANMTGANRLIIGVGWAVIVFIYWLKTRRAVRLPAQRRTEVLFLALATLYAFVVSLKESLVWYDGLVFTGLYAWYVWLAARQEREEPELEGPAEALARLPTRPRRLATLALFLFAGGAILANAEPFCEGLVATGKLLHINEFLLVQWLAPLASEAPEFVLATMFALRKQASLALGTLLSAKVNQWTLLVGTIPAVYAISAGTLDHPIPMNSFQMHEILLTAAQSLLAVAMLASLRLSPGQAMLLFALFTAQLISPVYEGAILWGLTGDQIHQLFSLIYVITALAVVLERPRHLWRLAEGARLRPKEKPLAQGLAAGPIRDETEEVGGL